MAVPSQLEQPFVEQLVRESEEYIPEMDPGGVFLLKDQSRFGDPEDPFIALLACPRCGTAGLITRRQLYGGERMICGSDDCSAEYHCDGEIFVFRKPQ